MSQKVYEGIHLLSPCPVVLVTSGERGKAENVMTVAWAGILNSGKENIVSVSIGAGKYTDELIRKTMEFGIALPDATLVKEADYCGCVSGREKDKFQECGFTRFYCSEIQAPLIDECYFNFACKVEEMLQFGDQRIFIGRVLKKFQKEGIPAHFNALTLIEPGYYALKPEKIWNLGDSAK